MPENVKNPNELSFEQNMARLKEIVKTLENGQATLEESIEIFREGRQLVEICEKKLSEAKMKITQITEEE